MSQATAIALYSPARSAQQCDRDLITTHALLYEMNEEHLEEVSKFLRYYYAA